MESSSVINPDSGGPKQKEENPKANTKPTVVVIMGATGSGKSRLAIDLASHFPIEIINADSMQVYHGLDVLTNKVPLQDQKGVPHHLLGTISPNVEFTSKDFRDHAIPLEILQMLATLASYFLEPFLKKWLLISTNANGDHRSRRTLHLINDILSRNRLPVIVGGTNYYIQALVSPFLLDDSIEDMDESCSSDHAGDKQSDSEFEFRREMFSNSYDCLKDLDPVAANRIHPNDHRKINQYLSLYARSGVLPSKLLQEKAMENWGRVDYFRYNCCFICVDASLAVLDQYVEQRVDRMVDAGLLNEVYDIYHLHADYTRGLRQAIGVREFKDLLRIYLFEGQNSREEDLTNGSHFQISTNTDDNMLKEYMSTILSSSNENQLKILLTEAIDKVKANTRRLVRRQRRRLNRLQTLFGWNIHYVDATESLSCMSNDIWTADVVEPAVRIIRSYLSEDTSLVPESEGRNGTEEMKLIQRDLWTQHICKACGNRVLRGAHEWEQHKQGRGHRKRTCRLRKSGTLCFE